MQDHALRVAQPLGAAHCSSLRLAEGPSHGLSSLALTMIVELAAVLCWHYPLRTVRIALRPGQFANSGSSAGREVLNLPKV